MSQSNFPNLFMVFQVSHDEKDRFPRGANQPFDGFNYSAPVSWTKAFKRRKTFFENSLPSKQLQLVRYLNFVFACHLSLSRDIGDWAREGGGSICHEILLSVVNIKKKATSNVYGNDQETV